jgi:predicted GNAT superfamily acetyltransferase
LNAAGALAAVSNALMREMKFAYRRSDDARLHFMNDVELQPISISDLSQGRLGEALLALNNAHARELSWLEPERFEHLVSQAFVARRIGISDAFLLALNQDASYDSPNFLWCRARYRRFLYVDRIVVAAAARGRGYARRLYEDLFARAAETAYERILCEVNVDPPNPISDAFHASLGFSEVGQRDLGTRTVRYLSRPATV